MLLSLVLVLTSISVVGPAVADPGTLATTALAPGLTLSNTTGSGPNKINILAANLSEPTLKPKYLYPGTVGATAPLTTLADRVGAIAAVNGGFFDIGATGAPRGIGIDDGAFINGPAAVRNNAAAFYADGTSWRAGLAEIFLDGTITLPGGVRLPATNLNSPNIEPNGIGIYNPLWGDQPRSQVLDGATRSREITITAGKVSKVSTSPGGKVPNGTVVVLGIDAGADSLAAVAVGDVVTVNYAPRNADGAAQVAVGGDPVLLKDGVVTTTSHPKNPRTAVGFSADGLKMWLVVVDGRSSASVGMTYVELGNYMKSLGADDALNLDGGGSSTLVARMPGATTVSVRNTPSDGAQRPIPNGIGFISTTIAAPTWATVNSVSTGEQRAPAIAANRGGHVAVVWEDDRDNSDPTSNLRSEIFIRMYRNGAAVYEKRLSNGGDSGVTNWRHIMPDVSMDDIGNTVVVWAGDNDGNDSYNIQYRVLSATGAVRASGTANATTAGQQTWPKVAVDPDGTPGSPSAVAFTVAWEDKQGTNSATIKATGFTNLTTKAYEKTVNLSGGTHRRPDVAVSANGDALVAWEDDQDGNGYTQIGLTRLAMSNGAVNLSHRSANANGTGQQYKPAIAATLNGDFAVAWESDHTGTRGVWTRSFTASGAARHTDIEVSTGAGAREPDIGIDDQNNTVIGWTVSGVDTWARGFNSDGTSSTRLAAQGLMKISAGAQHSMVVVVSARGEISVSYRDDNDGNGWGQILMGRGIINSIVQ